MKILNLRRLSRSGTLVARFDLTITPDVTLTDWQLRQTPKGLRAYPATTTTGRPAFIINPRDFSTIGRLAVTEYLEGNAHDSTEAA